MTKIIELRPEKNLINQNFEKYQFSSDVVPVTFEKELSNDVYRQEPEGDQDSWLEARLFAFHNHLYKNSFDSSCWFVDKNQDVWRLTSNGDLILTHSLTPPNSEENLFTYNPSIAFGSANIVVLTNGAKSLEILVENSTQKKSFKTSDVTPGVLMDARYVEKKSLIIVAMCCIAEVDSKKCSQLVVLSYSYNCQECSEKSKLELYRKQILNVKGPIEYVYIESSGDHVHAITQDAAIFVHDSIKTVEIESSKILIDNEVKIPKYCWSQDEDSLTVWVKCPEKNPKEHVKINVNKTNIIIDTDVVMVQGDTQHCLDPDMTTWSYEKETLKLELGKLESGLMWSELIKGDTGGECLPNESLAAEIHARLAHMCSSEPRLNAEQPTIGFNAEQLEECDLRGKDHFLQRIDLNDHTTTHLAMLGASNHVLFTHKLPTGQAVCLRHDHAGCVWEFREGDSNDWKFINTITFPGFGYVEASKTNKKFCVSPPNGSYVAIVEHTRHAFLYEKPADNARIAKQRIVDLDPRESPIMGAVATNSHLILLTKGNVYQHKVYN